MNVNLKIDGKTPCKTELEAIRDLFGKKHRNEALYFNNSSISDMLMLI